MDEPLKARHRGSPAKTRLAIFDIDGTLTDSVEIHQQAFRETLEGAGLAPFDADFSRYEHHTDSFIANQVFRSRRGRDMTEREVDDFEACLQFSILQRLAGRQFCEIPGAISFVERLVRHTSYAVAYATGSLRIPARHKLSIGFPGDPNAVLFTSNRQPVREEILREAIESSRLARRVPRFEDIVSFGDGLWDLQAARALGIRFVGIGRRNAQLFRRSDCLAHGEDFAALEDLLG